MSTGGLAFLLLTPITQQQPPGLARLPAHLAASLLGLCKGKESSPASPCLLLLKQASAPSASGDSLLGQAAPRPQMPELSLCACGEEHRPEVGHQGPSPRSVTHWGCSRPSPFVWLCLGVTSRKQGSCAPFQTCWSVLKPVPQEIHELSVWEPSGKVALEAPCGAI